MAPDRPNRFEALRTLRLANADMAFYTVFITLTSGSFLVGFVQLCGGSDAWIGLLTAIPSLLGALQIVGGIVGRRFGSYKPFVAPGWLLWRLFYVPVAMLPLVAMDPSGKLAVLAACVILAWAATFLVNPVFFDWLAELVPAHSRGEFFGRRNALAAGVAAASGVLGGVLLDHFRSRHQDPLGFAWIFGIGVACALAGHFGFFVRMRDVPRAAPVREGLGSSLRSMAGPLRDRGFRTVLLFLAAAVFSQAFAGNFWSAYALESLQIPFLTLQLAGVAHSIGNIAASRVWGFLSDRYGNKPMLAFAAAGMCFTPVPWLLTKPGPQHETYNSALLIAAHLPMGVIWSGIAVCQFNLLLATSKPEERSSYLGLGMALQALIGGVSPILGAALMSALRGGAFGPMEVALAYKTLFVATICLRATALIPLLRVHEPGAQSFLAALRHLRRATPKGLSAMRALSRSPSVEQRERAIEEVGEAQMTLAAEDLIRSLHDPAPRVRRRAAEALGRLGLKSAIPDLIHQLDEHPDLVEEETIEALGVLRAREAVPHLVALLHSPRSALRRAAAKALGRIGHADAVEPLVRAAQPGSDPDLRRASLQALRTLGDVRAAPAILAALEDPLPSVRIAAAEAAAELGLAEAAEPLRRSLARYADEASSETAYALGAVGGQEDLPAILREAERSQSIITRSRCLLGAARLLGCEPALYRLALAGEADRDRLATEALRGDPEALRLFAEGDWRALLLRLAKEDPRLEALEGCGFEEALWLALAKRLPSA
ncbi:MAG: MFS transporter [Fimbriimonadales bacterium]|nr:MFS transporter [Fimbriimonadales bacterium]